MQLLPALLVLLAPITTFALPLETSPIDNPLEVRQSGSVTCGSTTYTNGQVSTSRNVGCNHVKAGTTVNGYPHIYNNYEGFNFANPGPWYEFPLKTSAYTGGKYFLMGRCVMRSMTYHLYRIAWSGPCGLQR